MAARRLGLSIPLADFNIRECVDIASRAEEAGYTDAWTSEIGGSDAFVPLAAVSGATRHMRLGTGVVPVYTRPPALLAMTAGSMQALSGGRFCLGLGTSNQSIVEGWMERTFDRPLLTVREAVDALRLLQYGEPVTIEGETLRMDRFRLARGLAAPVPILLGALGPRMLRLSGEIADGVILSHITAPALPALLAEVSAGAELAGRTLAEFDVAARVLVAIDEDESDLRSVLRRELAQYGRSAHYAAHFARQGFAEEAERMRAAWERRDGPAAADAVSDAMVDAVAVWGDTDTCLARVATLRELGVTTPIIVPVSVDPDRAVRRRRRVRVVESMAAA